MDDATPPAGITSDEWSLTPLAVRHLVGALLVVVGQQQQQLAQLQARVADLEARLNQHSQNSPKPPSSDPPNAPPRPSRPPRGRTKGAQPGHERHERPAPDPDHINDVRQHHPESCPHCHMALSTTLPDACAVRTQYVWELPVVEPHITAHHYHTVCCPGCGDLVSAPRPPDVPPGSFGPQTAATVALLHGCYRISDRELPHLLDDLCGLPISVGSVVDLQQTVSAALAPVYTTIQGVVQQQAHVNMDETGWKEAGKRRWLWVVVSTLATLFHVAASRSAKVLTTLLGAEFGGLVSSDRLKSYQVLPPERRQICWAHLIRNLLAYYERDGPLGGWAADMLAQSDIVFALWHRFLSGQIDRDMLVASMLPVQVNVRALRPAVLWRKGCFGAQSAAGNTFVERILTVSATCRQQNRHLRTFLTEAVAAYWAGQPAPTLLSMS